MGAGRWKAPDTTIQKTCVGGNFQDLTRLVYTREESPLYTVSTCEREKKCWRRCKKPNLEEADLSEKKDYEVSS